MSKQKTKRPARADGKSGRMLLPGWWKGLSSRGRRTLLLGCVHLVLLGGLVGGVAFGLHAAGSYVHGLDRYQGPIKVVLRVRVHKQELLATTHQIDKPTLPADMLVLCKDVDSAGGVVVESGSSGSRDDKTFRLTADDVQPDWLARFQYVRANIQKQAEALANQPGANSALPDWFDAGLPGRIAKAIESDPYVKPGVRVDKQLIAPESGSAAFSRRIVLTVTLRKPVGQVLIADKWGELHLYLLDAKGVVLESRGKVNGHGPQLIALPQLADFAVDHKWEAGLSPGTALTTPDIQAGLDLLVKLSAQPFAGEIAEVNLANFNTKRDPHGSQLTFKTYGIESEHLGPDTYGWGMAKDNLDVEKNDTLGKLQILCGIWATYGRLNLQHLKTDKRGETRLWNVPGKPFFVEAPDAAGPAVPPGPTSPPGGHGGHVAGRAE